MGIRSYITVQIARISCGSLVELPRPLKICYSGEVLRVKNNSLNLSRQATQIGLEIIGIKENVKKIYQLENGNKIIQYREVLNLHLGTLSINMKVYIKYRYIIIHILIRKS